MKPPAPVSAICHPAFPDCATLIRATKSHSAVAPVSDSATGDFEATSTGVSDTPLALPGLRCAHPGYQIAQLCSPGKRQRHRGF
ncbi:hypothetical protein FYL58_22525 [Klebsiella aerogenes]|nr:hypothetical protein [Klebsiella aerogenes]